MTITPEQLAEIENRANAATPGTWTNDRGRILPTPHADRSVVICRHLPDAEFIAHARTDVPALLAEVKRLRAELKELQEDSAKLNALEVAGVDNWDGYSYAMEILSEGEGQREAETTT